MDTDTATPNPDLPPRRRWLTIDQLAKEFPAFTKPAIRSLIQRSRRHYDHRGVLVEGNGLDSTICQPGGKNGKILVDAIGFALWLERWAGKSLGTRPASCNTYSDRTNGIQVNAA